MKNPRTTTQVIVAADKNRLTDKSTREHKISQKNNFQHPFNLAYFNRSSKCNFIANRACYVCYFLFYCMKSTKICIFEYLPRSCKCTSKYFSKFDYCPSWTVSFILVFYNCNNLPHGPKQAWLYTIVSHGFMHWHLFVRSLQSRAEVLRRLWTSRSSRASLMAVVSERGLLLPWTTMRRQR